MDDLISRAAAIEAIYNSMRYGEGYKAVCTRAIERIPAVDAAPVVRCKDCKWFDCKNYVCNSDIMTGRIADCGCYPNFNVEPDWFCADGERRESE